MAPIASQLMTTMDPVAVKFFGKQMFALTDRALLELKKKGTKEDKALYYN